MPINLKTDWSTVFENPEIKNNLDNILSKLDVLYATKTIYPKKEDIFKCFNYFNVKKTSLNVLIISTLTKQK